MGAENKRYLIVESLAFFMLIKLFVVLAFFSYKDFEYFVVGLGIFLLLMIGLRICFFSLSYKNNSLIIKEESFYNLIAETIPGGYFDILLNDSLTFVSIGDKFLEFVGYSTSEIETNFNNSLLNMIEKDYRDNVLDVLKYQTRQESKSQIYYKIKCKNNETKEIINIFRIHIDKKGQKIVKNFLLEPSSFKQLQHERDLDNMRYKIVAEQSESIIFDYNPKDKSIYLNSHFERKFGYTIKGNLFDYIDKYHIIYKNDRDKFLSLAVEDKEYNETEIRLKKADGQYIWCKLRITTIMGENNKPSRLIGKIIDVDESKREKIKLIEKTRRDFMTGVYNRQTTESLINEVIQKNSKSLAAFLLIDIDNFKNINDRLGHMQGDNVLTEISEEIKLIFRSSDIIGRIGGDEFVVFIKDIYEENHAVKKAKEILETIRYMQKDKPYKVTVSIGIAFFDKDGSSFKQLYINADKALYCAKDKGKNTYELYRDVMCISRESSGIEENNY